MFSCTASCSKPQFVAAFLLCLAFAATGPTPSAASRVLELGDRFLDVSHEGQWLVMFYAPWCGHCKRTEPIWLQIAQTLSNTNIRVGRVDCTRFTAVGQHYNIRSYPTIMFFKGHQQHVYTGDRTNEDLLPYARRMSGPPVQTISRPESMTTLRTLHDLYFVYVGDRSGALWNAYETVASGFQAHGFFYAASTKVAGQHVSACVRKNDIEATSASTTTTTVADVVPPCVAVCKANTSFVFSLDDDIPAVDGDGPVADFVVAEDPSATGDSLSSDAVAVADIERLNRTLTQWVNEERFAHFPKITRANINQAIQTRKFLVLTVVEENKLNELPADEHDFREMMENFTHQYYDRYHKRFQFGWIGSPELAHSIAMDHLQTPHLIVLNATTAEHHLPANLMSTGNMTMETVCEFLDDIHAGEAPAYGGNTISVRLYRMYFETIKSLTDLWRGNPVLTSLIFGLPMGFLSLIVYSICCADIMDANEDDDDEDDPDAQHEKRE